LDVSDEHIDPGRLDDLEHEALLPIYEAALDEDPEDFLTLAWLGNAYTRLGRLEEGLRIDLRLTALLPDDPVARYNLCCSYALLGQKEEAIGALRRAVRCGYRDADHLRTDPDVNALRDDPRFRMILDSLESDG